MAGSESKKVVFPRKTMHGDGHVKRLIPWGQLSAVLKDSSLRVSFVKEKNARLLPLEVLVWAMFKDMLEGLSAGRLGLSAGDLSAGCLSAGGLLAGE